MAPPHTRAVHPRIQRLGLCWGENPKSCKQYNLHNRAVSHEALRQATEEKKKHETEKHSMLNAIITVLGFSAKRALHVYLTTSKLCYVFQLCIWQAFLSQPAH